MDLHADAGQITRFVNALFPYAADGTWLSLRCFDQHRRDIPPIFIRPIAVNGSPQAVADAATKAADDAAHTPNPSVFAPPVCTFSNPHHARAADLANGLVLSVELDSVNPELARIKLESILGPCTLTIESGSLWTDQQTGQILPNLHLHWRLSEPTTTDDQHNALNHARSLASLLAGGDPTAKPTVHCLRWPGSWNTKNTPRMAVIASENKTAEIHLIEAVQALEEAVEAAGLNVLSSSPSSSPEDPTGTYAIALAAVPNAGVHYNDWIRFGYAAWRASGGSDDGYSAWDAWSRKSTKYNPAEQEAAWKRIGKAIQGAKVPRTIGAGTIIYHALAAGWRRPIAHLFQQAAQGEELSLFDPWAEIQPPDFPIEALPPVLQAFCEDRSIIIGADPAALAWAAISAASTALHGNLRLRMKQYDNWSVPPAIWVALIGPSSSKKTPIIDAAWEPLIRAQTKDITVWRQALADWQRLPKNEREPDPPKPTRRLVSHDGTMEALQDILGRQDRGIGVLRDELAGWIGSLEKYAGQKAGSADRAFFLQAYNGGPNVIDRISRGTIAVNNLLVTICGGIQPERLRQFGDLTDDGLWQRFIPVIVRNSSIGTDSPPSKAVADYRDTLTEMLMLSPDNRPELSRPAQELRAEVERQTHRLQQDNVLGARFSSFCGKLDGLWGRLCLVLNYLDPRPSIGYIVPRETAERATTILFKSVIPSAARVYASTGGGGADAEATRSVAGYILTKRKSRVLASDLSHNVRACRGAPLHHVQQIVSPLVAGGWMAPEKDWNPTVWIVTDAVHIQFEKRARSEAMRRSYVHELISGKT